MSKYVKITKRQRICLSKMRERWIKKFSRQNKRDTYEYRLPVTV